MKTILFVLVSPLEYSRLSLGVKTGLNRLETRGQKNLGICETESGKERKGGGGRKMVHIGRDGVRDRKGKGKD